MKTHKQKLFFDVSSYPFEIINKSYFVTKKHVFRFLHQIYINQIIKKHLKNHRMS